MQIYTVNNADLNLIKLYSVNQSHDANNMIHIRNSNASNSYDADDGYYIQGPKCHINKDIQLNNTERFKIGLIFNSDNIIFLDFLNRLKKHIIKLLAINKNSFFEKEDIDEHENIETILTNIFLDSHTINASKGTIKLIVHCNSRNNTKWANEYQLEAETNNGEKIDINTIISSTMFYPVIRIRGIRTKGKFQIEFMLRKIIFPSNNSPINALPNNHIIKENNNTDIMSASTPSFTSHEKLNEKTISSKDNIDEIEITLPNNQNKTSNNEIFKVRKPKNVYQHWVKQFKYCLQTQKHDYISNWLNKNNIHQACVILDQDIFSDEDETLGYDST